MGNKTLEQVYSKPFNRFLKMIYFFIFGLILGLYVFIVWEESSIGIKEAAPGFIVILLIFEFIRRAFYYVITGTIMPKK
jgi:hypothetical protein